jgi:hypothetical protein
MYGRYANHKFNPRFYGIIVASGDNFIGGIGHTFEGPFIVACSTANLVRIMYLLN